MLGNKNLAFAKSQQPECPAVTYLWHVKVSEGAARRAACRAECPVSGILRGVRAGGVASQQSVG